MSNLINISRKLPDYMQSRLNMNGDLLMSKDRVDIGDIYREQCAHVRSMNEILYKLPTIFSAVVGGLWYFAVSQSNDKIISAMIFIFTAILCICFSYIMSRFGRAFGKYISNLNELDREYKVTLRDYEGRPKPPSTVMVIQFILIIASVFSSCGAWYFVDK